MAYRSEMKSFATDKPVMVRSITPGSKGYKAPEPPSAKSMLMNTTSAKDRKAALERALYNRKR